MMRVVYSVTRKCLSLKTWNVAVTYCRLQHRHIHQYRRQLHRFHTQSCLYGDKQRAALDEVSTKSEQLKDSESNNDTKKEELSDSSRRLAVDILNKVSKIDKMFQSVQVYSAQRQVSVLLSFGICEADVCDILTSNPKLLRESKLAEFLSFLESYAFKKSDIVTMLRNDDGNVIHNGPKKIENMFNTLLSAGQSFEQVTSLVANHPQVVSMTSKQILTRLNSLKALFKTDDVFTLILKSPSTLFGDWDEFEEKFKYVFHVMKITQPQMVKSHVFDHSLKHIKCRHVFLTRSGQWFAGKLKPGEKSPNPRLSEIVDLPDERFSTKLGGMNILEYRTFCKLLDKEENEIEEE